MTIQELFIMSNEQLERVISQIKDDQWEFAMPPGTSTKPTSLVEAVRYHTYDDAWVPDVLAGKSIDEVGDSYDDLLTTENMRADYTHYNERAIAAVKDGVDLDKVTHLSYGDFPAREYLQHVTSFRAFRVYDIAKLIGIDTTLPAEFIDALIAEYSPIIEGYRAMGVFPPALPVDDDASPQAKLLAMAGRKY